MADLIQLRRDTAANWADVNPILAQAEVGVELPSRKFKIGDGVLPWSELPYATGDLAQQTADGVTITGGSITGIEDLAVEDGGTGASNPEQARANLGLGNVDNTADVDKPISTAVAAALSGKVGIESVVGKTRMSGFPVNSASDYLVTLSYNETTRTVTVTPTGADFKVYVDGVEYTKVGAQSIAHGTQQGGHFVYYDNTGALVTSQTPWNLEQTAPVAFVFWDATNSRAVPFFELHHAGRDVFMHARLHAIDGTQVVSGFAASGFTLNDGSTDAAVSYAIGSGVLADEDIRVTTQALADGGPYWIMERAGASGDWRVTRTNTLPFLHAANVLQYNQNTGATWQRTNVPEDQFVNYYVFGVPALPTTDITPAPSSTPQIIIVPGQAVYATEAAAHAESTASLAWGNIPFQEIAPLYQVTMRFNASNPAAFANTARCAISRMVRVVGTRASITAAAQTDHGALAGLTDDDHSIYGMAAPSAAAVAYNAGGTTTIALDNGRTEVFTATAATGSTTWAVTGLVAGKATAALLVLTNGGSQTQNWPAGSKFEGGVAPTLTAAGKDKLLLLWDGTELTIAALKDVK